MKKIALLVLACTLVLSCGKGKDEQAVREAIDATPMLYTAEATAKVFVESSDSPESIRRYFGERVIIIPVEANVKAGINLHEIEDIKISGKTLYITLPEPIIEIESTRIDHSGITSSVTGIRDSFSEAEITSLSKAGREKIEEKLPELGLIEPAIIQAEQTIRGIASQLGLEVVFDVKTSYTPLELKNLVR